MLNVFIDFRVEIIEYLDVVIIENVHEIVIVINFQFQILLISNYSICQSNF